MLSAAAAMNAFSQARWSSNSSQSNSGFDGAVLGDVIKAVGESMEEMGSEAANLAEGAGAAGKQAGQVAIAASKMQGKAMSAMTKSVGAILNTIKAPGSASCVEDHFLNWFVSLILWILDFDSSSCEVSSSVARSGQSGSQSSEEVQTESTQSHSQTATCITCSTYGGAPTDDVQSWTNSIMQDTFVKICDLDSFFLFSIFF